MTPQKLIFYAKKLISRGDKNEDSDFLHYMIGQKILIILMVNLNLQKMLINKISVVLINLLSFFMFRAYFCLNKVIIYKIINLCKK